MTTAAITFEIEVRLSGDLIPGRPQAGPTYHHGGLPAEPATVEDLAVTDIGALTYKAPRQWDFASLLEGVDRKSEAFLRIEANILAMFAEEAENAISEEAAR